MEQLFTLISSYGFPMVLSIYLLLRFESLLRVLKESIDTLILLSKLKKTQKRKETLALRSSPLKKMLQE
jgi:hypothetical protein